jgi:tRNA(fMet)-specific endonuclease VapC
MILLDTDTFTLHYTGHQKVTERVSKAVEIPKLTIVTQIEALRGRQDAMMKAADAAQLLRAQQGLVATAKHLALFDVVPIDEAAAAEFERLIGTKGLRRLGRGDLLIASIAVTRKATVVTRNRKDYEKITGLLLENWAD